VKKLPTVKFTNNKTLIDDGSEKDKSEGEIVAIEERVINEDKSTTDTDSILFKNHSGEMKKSESRHRFSEDSRDFLTKKTDFVQCEYKENMQIVNNLIKTSSVDIIEEEYVLYFY